MYAVVLCSSRMMLFRTSMNPFAGPPAACRSPVPRIRMVVLVAAGVVAGEMPAYDTVAVVTPSARAYHLKVTAPPAASEYGEDSSWGPLAPCQFPNASAPAGATEGTEGPVPGPIGKDMLTAADPVFEMVRVTVTIWPWTSGPGGDTCSDPTRAARAVPSARATTATTPRIQRPDMMSMTLGKAHAGVKARRAALYRIMRRVPIRHPCMFSGGVR